MPQAVADNPHLTADMAARLRVSEDPLVRVLLAYSRHCSPQTRDRLLASPEAEVATGVDVIATPFYLELLGTHGEAVNIQPLLVDHPNFPREAPRGFVDEADPSVLPADPEPAVAATAAVNPVLPRAQMDHTLPQAGLRRQTRACPRMAMAMAIRIEAGTEPMNYAATGGRRPAYVGGQVSAIGPERGRPVREGPTLPA